MGMMTSGADPIIERLERELESMKERCDRLWHAREKLEARIEKLTKHIGDNANAYSRRLGEDTQPMMQVARLEARIEKAIKEWVRPLESYSRETEDTIYMRKAVNMARILRGEE
jgi:chromosome segregation ATPase